MFKKVREGKTCRLDRSGQTGQKSRRGEAWGSNWEDLEGPTVWSEVLDRVWRLQCFCGQVDVTARRHVTDTVRLQRSFQTKTRRIQCTRETTAKHPGEQTCAGCSICIASLPPFPHVRARAHTHTRICTHARTAQRQSASKRGDVKSFTHPRRSAGAPCCQRSRRRGSGGMSRSEARCPAGLSPVPQPVINTDRQRDVHTHTRARARSHTRCFGVSDVCRDQPLTSDVCPMFHTLSSGKTLVGAASPTLCCHTPNTHTHTHTPPAAAAGCCAPTAACTHRGGSHTL